MNFTSRTTARWKRFHDFSLTLSAAHYFLLLFPIMSHMLGKYGTYIRCNGFKSWGVKTISTVVEGRAIAQASSRWLPTAAARVRARVWSSGICGG
jgi:hypothetical protein